MKYHNRQRSAKTFAALENLRFNKDLKDLEDLYVYASRSQNISFTTKADYWIGAVSSWA